MIEALVAQGFAYAVDGDVYFRVARFPEYGRLSGQRPEMLQEQEPNPLKEDPRDFALWKANKPGEDTWWESPWGRGRPGWHIECSVMSEKHLGPEFEIHGGGLDLVFPHHENEIAQSRALGPSVRAHLDAQRDASFRRRGDAQVGRQRRLAEGRARSLGSRDAARLLHDRALAEAARLLGRDARCRGGAGRALPRGVPRTCPARGRRRLERLRRGARRRLQHARRARGHARVARTTSCSDERSTCSGSRRSATREEAPPDVVELAERRSRRARARRLRRGRPPARRDRGGGLGRARRARTASSSFRGGDARARLRPQRGARGAAGAPAGAGGLGERARGRRAAVARRRAARAGATRARADRGGRSRPITRASSPGRSRTATRTPGSSQPERVRCWPASTR